jgi:cysteine dioxygenase
MPVPTIHCQVKGNDHGSKLLTFDNLVQDLRAHLGAFSGIDSAAICPEDLKLIMNSYQSNPTEWQRFAFKDYSRCYTRNLIDEGNGKYNLVWPGPLP